MGMLTKLVPHVGRTDTHDAQGCPEKDRVGVEDTAPGGCDNYILEIAARDVRMVTDGDTVDKANPSTNPAERYGRHHFHAEYEKPLAAILAAGIPVHDDGARGGIMHNKFVVLNGKTVWTGSWNMNMGDLNYWNHAIVLNSAPLAARFTANLAFEQELLLIEEATAKTKQAAPCPGPFMPSAPRRRPSSAFPDIGAAGGGRSPAALAL